MRLTGAVREKFRHCRGCLVAAHRRSPEEYILKIHHFCRDEMRSKVGGMVGALAGNGKSEERVDDGSTQARDPQRDSGPRLGR